MNKKKLPATAVTLAIAIILVLVVRLSGMDKAVATLLILAMACILFVTELIPLAYTACSVPVMLVLCECATAAQGWAGLSNDSVVLFAAMFVIGGAMFRTGAAETVGKWVLSKAGTNTRRLVTYLMILVGVFSSVMSNTGAVAVMMPVCIGIADAARMERKKLLMPLAMMASLGGTITMVGTPPNITVNTVYQQSGLGRFAFFEYAWIGIPLAIIGGLFLVIIYGKDTKAADAEQYEIIVEPLTTNQKLSLAVLVVVVIAMATEIIPISVAAVMGAIFCRAKRLISSSEALEDVDWTTIFLFAGMLPMSSALDRTGAGKMIANAAVRIMGGSPSEFVAISVLFLIAGGLTQVMSNTASCALLAPIGLQLAEALGASPAGVLMAIGIASSCAFMTPMATPPNTLVMGPGKIKFNEYLKIGTPLVLIGYVICILVIPRVWPFFG